MDNKSENNTEENMQEPVFMIETLETIVEDYEKFQKESQELLGFGHTDKRYIVQKKTILDERLKKLKSKWIETLSAIDPEYGDLYKRTSPSKKTLDIVKQKQVSENCK